MIKMHKLYKIIFIRKQYTIQIKLMSYELSKL